MARKKRVEHPCCPRHPECDADKCGCMTKCLAQICDCTGKGGKSYGDAE